MLRRLMFAVLLAAVADPASALTVAQLTPKERQAYDQLLKGPNPQDEARAYLATRGFYKECQAVNDKKVPASQLGLKPVAFAEKYATPEEMDQIENAQYLNIISNLGLSRTTAKA